MSGLLRPSPSDDYRPRVPKGGSKRMIALLVRLIRHVADIWLRIICDMRLHTNYPTKPTSRPTFLNSFARIEERDAPQADRKEGPNGAHVPPGLSFVLVD